MEDHIRHVKEVLTALKNTGVRLKIKKCTFFSQNVEYLGQMIKTGRLEIDRTNTASLQGAKISQTRTELSSFLGLCNVYCRFINDCEVLEHSLNRLLKKGEPDWYELDEEQLRSIRSFIDRVCSPPVLSLEIRDLFSSVDTDACDYRICCTLFQTHPDRERKPLGYWSRSITEPKRNYSKYERKCLSVIWGLKTLRPYYMYETFVVHSDHHELCLLYTSPSPRDLSTSRMPSSA